MYIRIRKCIVIIYYIYIYKCAFRCIHACMQASCHTYAYVIIACIHDTMTIMWCNVWINVWLYKITNFMHMHGIIVFDWIKLHVMSCTNNWWSAYSSYTIKAQLRKVPIAFWIVNNTYIQRHCLRRSCNCQSSPQFPSGCRFFSGTHPSACSPIKRRTQHQVSCTSNTSTTSPELTEMVCSVDMLRYPVVTLHSVPRCYREKGEKLTHLCNAWMCCMLCGVVGVDRVDNSWVE